MRDQDTRARDMYLKSGPNIRLTWYIFGPAAPQDYTPILSNFIRF